ncbi:MAG TPA: hypothetical protein ENI67_10360 [Gammaproteobacteria bacterium]|nr:hypothetical protein [Gammaproteobacteria bacterium]
MNKILLLLIVSLSLASVSFLAFAREPEIRLYKMTRDGHSEKYMLFGKGDNPGCHNTPYTYHVYKVAVLAFKNCSVYSAKNCPPATILPAYWKNKDKVSTKMKQGTRWFLTRDGSEVAVASWSCEVKKP